MPQPHQPCLLVLVSGSPARLALLRAAGVEPRVLVSDVDEEAVAAENASSALGSADMALLLARAKAEAVAPQVSNSLVLGCDSVLEFGGQSYGKPGLPEVAIQRWRSMRGRSGVLHTGHWLIDTRDADHGGTNGAIGATASTTVHFAAISDDEIAAYVATGEPLHVAGGFTLDGLGAPYIAGIDGDPSNVIGLSLPLLRALLSDVGLPWYQLRQQTASRPTSRTAAINLSRDEETT